MDYENDHALAARLAQQTGQRLVELLDDPSAPFTRLGKLGDRTAHRLIVEELSRHRPADAVLSEEGNDDLSRLRAKRVWIIDPLDGTASFGVNGSWAVHVALCENGLPTAGAVAVPALGTTFATDPPHCLPERRPGCHRIVMSWSMQHTDGHLLAAALDAEIVFLGSAGVKAMLVVRGDMDAYVTTGGLCEWDSCAPTAVAQAAGLHVSRLDGSPLLFNLPDPWSRGLVICRPDLADELLNVLASLHRSSSSYRLSPLRRFV